MVLSLIFAPFIFASSSYIVSNVLRVSFLNDGCRLVGGHFSFDKFVEPVFHLSDCIWLEIAWLHLCQSGYLEVNKV